MSEAAESSGGGPDTEGPGPDRPEPEGPEPDRPEPDQDPVVPDADAGPDPDLPDAVTRRAAGYAAEALRTMLPAQVPAQLRFAMKLRAGTPTRRLIDALSVELRNDADFRDQVGAVLGQSDPLAQMLLRGEDPPAQDAVGAAALLFLVRPEGWRERLVAYLSAAPTPDPPAPDAAVVRELDSLRAKLQRCTVRREQESAQAQDTLRLAKGQRSEDLQRLREQLTASKAEAATARTQADELAARVAELELQARRLRGQVEKLTGQAETDKAVQRGARNVATARSKVLLEVLAEAVAGLQDELVFPSGVQRPADLVEARGPSPAVVSRRLTGTAELGEALTLPRCHLIVDGYNVSKGAWESLSLQQQRDRLIQALSGLQARTRAEITVVFDGADVAAAPSVVSRGVRVRFSMPGELADKLIVRLARTEPVGRPVIVVSSDAWLAEGALSAGARTADRNVLSALLGLKR